MGTPGCPQDACHDEDPDDGACEHGDLFSECAPCQAVAAGQRAAWHAEQDRLAAVPLTEPPF